VKELTQMREGELLSLLDRIKIEVFLRLGEVKAQVKPKAAITSDFSITTPNAAASVKGTEIQRVSYHPPTGTRTQLVTGSLLLQSSKGSTLTGAGDQSVVQPTGDVLTAADLTRDATRVHVEPTGLTDSEIEQIEISNQPQSTTTPLESEATFFVPGDNEAALLLRFVIE
jgi:hypothetical protein